MIGWDALLVWPVPAPRA